jgi:hypothetical protein
MASHVFFDQHCWTFNDAGADDEEGRQDIFRAKVIEEFPAQCSVTMPRNAQRKKKTD